MRICCFKTTFSFDIVDKEDDGWEKLESDSEGGLVEFDLNIFLFDPAAARSNAHASAIALTKFSSFVLRQPSHPTSG